MPSYKKVRAISAKKNQTFKKIKVLKNLEMRFLNLIKIFHLGDKNSQRNINQPKRLITDKRSRVNIFKNLYVPLL